MKPAIYIFGIGSFLVLLAGILGILAEFPRSEDLLLAGTILLFFIYLPLLLIEKYRQDRKVDKIIESHKGKSVKGITLNRTGKAPKGWSMNDSPFRERKSGLTWGGGTISHSTATREKRRTFLKH